MAGVLLPLAGCATNNTSSGTAAPVDDKAEQLIAEISGPMDLGGLWIDEKDETMTLTFMKMDTNTYEVEGYWGVEDPKIQTWTFNGTYDEASGMLIYDSSNYETRTTTPEDTQVTGDETSTSGSISKQSDDTIQWTDSKLDAPHVLKRSESDVNPNTAPKYRLADGPFVQNTKYTPHISDEDAERFNKAVEGQIGVKYTPIQLLATQVVNGTNYAYLAHGLFVLNGEQEGYVIITINEDPQGSLDCKKFESLDVNALSLKDKAEVKNLLGGWQIADNDGEGVDIPEAADAFAAAFADSTDDIGNLVTILLLGTETEGDATTYRFLARGTSSDIAPAKAYYVIDVKTAGGTSTVSDIKALDMPAYIGLPSAS